MSADNKPRLAILSEPLPDMAALLLQSLAGTHADVFEFSQLSENYRLGIRAVSGTFIHKPTGREYIVAVCAIPSEVP